MALYFLGTGKSDDLQKDARVLLNSTSGRRFHQQHDGAVPETPAQLRASPSSGIVGVSSLSSADMLDSVSDVDPCDIAWSTSASTRRASGWADKAGLWLGLRTPADCVGAGSWSRVPPARNSHRRFVLRYIDSCQFESRSTPGLIALVRFRGTWRSLSDHHVPQSTSRSVTQLASQHGRQTPPFRVSFGRTTQPPWKIATGRTWQSRAKCACC